MSNEITAYYEDRMKEIGQLYVDGEIDSGTFQVMMRQELRDVHALQIIAAADGNQDNVDPNDWLRMGNPLQQQYDYLEDFSHQIDDGTVSDGAIANRASLYAGSGKASYSRKATGFVQLPAHPGDGSTPCLGRCGCKWTKNSDGSYSWERGKDDSCDVCIEREERWDHYMPEMEAA